MGIFSQIQCIFVFLSFVLDFGRSELYPSIQWTPLNSMFASNRTQCVHPMSKLIFVCPNTATIVTRLYHSSYLDPQYENLWLVSGRSYERCEVNKTSDRQLLVCDKPFSLKYYTTIFKRYTASNEPEFQPGKDYYFIATSDGSQSSLHSTSGGHCRTHNMKLKFHICTNNKDPRCQSNDMCNGVTPTQAPTTARPTSQPTTAESTPNIRNGSYVNYTLPTTRISIPDGPENEKNMLLKESTYQITIGFLLFACVLLLISSAILIYRLRRKRKSTSASSRDSGSSVDSPDGVTLLSF